LFSASPPSDVPEYKVGVAERAFKPNKAYNWRGAKTHALLTTVWYPAVATAVEQAQWIPPTGQAFASAGKAARDAAMVSTPAKLPLIVLSHGTGGSAPHGAPQTPCADCDSVTPIRELSAQNVDESVS
jgi:predicted dienelactone hydrolase